MVNKPLQWHCAFQAILQIELEEDQDCLQFLKEYNLTEKPLRIDTLVVKKIPGLFCFLVQKRSCCSSRLFIYFCNTPFSYGQ
ncbi:hypothetical protein [Enterocloster hominis (ex Hitch et al. 2024)]|uniref:hypothetical protein n=1 Tax=Enterocloster hominis (ex Hitch et al. 2024) TaxID=1917870 RepID=UPI002E30D2AC|nr:hypothetical protein [Lachnoclostridium pacaense]